MSKSGRRRGNHEGGISWRPGENRYVVSITLPNGERPVGYAKTKADAVEVLRRLERERDQGAFSRDKRMTVDGLFDLWLKDVVAIGRRPSTREGYEASLRRVRSSIGKVRIAELKPPQVQAAISELSRKGYKPSVVKETYIVVRMALGQAVAWEMIPKNPCDGVTLPEADLPELRILDREQLSAVMAELKRNRLFPLFQLLALTGMRKGEALGLSWSDIDDGKITIRRTMLARGELGPPKTGRARRTISIPPAALRSLARHWMKQEEEARTVTGWSNDHNLVFTGVKGQPLCLATPNSTLKWILRRAGLAHVRPHDFRHTLATTLMASGIFPRQVQVQLGHSDAAFTMMRYGHVTPDMRGQVAEEIQRLMGFAFDDGEEICPEE
jgi:integrase